MFQVGDLFDKVPGPLTECTFVNASAETAQDWFRVVGLQQKKAPEKMAWFGNLVIRCIWIGVTYIKATPYIGTNFRLGVEVRMPPRIKVALVAAREPIIIAPPSSANSLAVTSAVNFGFFAFGVSALDFVAIFVLTLCK